MHVKILWCLSALILYVVKLYHSETLTANGFLYLTYIYRILLNCELLKRRGEKGMNQEHSDGHASIAWYKLADLISRREREKALNVYRLLAHSFEDRAYVLQLEADILLYLDDDGAKEKYKQAAFLYKKEKRWINAISVCEHLLFRDPDNFDLLSMLIDFYAIVDWEDKFTQRLTSIFKLLKSNAVDVDQVFRSIKIVFNLAQNSESKKWIYSAVMQQESVMPKALLEQVSLISP